MKKRDPVFPGLNPAALPLPPSPASGPSVPALEVPELNKKIDAMGGNLSARLEEKLGQYLGAMVPPPALSKTKRAIGANIKITVFERRTVEK